MALHGMMSGLILLDWGNADSIEPALAYAVPPYVPPTYISREADPIARNDEEGPHIDRLRLH